MEHISTKKRPSYSPYTPSLRPSNPIYMYVPQKGSILGQKWPFLEQKTRLFYHQKVKKYFELLDPPMAKKPENNIKFGFSGKFPIG